MHLNLGKQGMNIPNTCSVVLVAGSAPDNLQTVMDMVDSLVQDLSKIPYAVVLLIENPDLTLKTTRYAMSPAVVSIQCLPHYLV